MIDHNSKACVYIYILYICLNLFIMYHFTIQYLLLNQGAEHSFSTAPTLPLDPFGTIPVDRSNSPFSEGTPATNGCTLMKFSVHYTLPWLSPSTSRHPDHSRPHGVRWKLSSWSCIQRTLSGRAVTHVLAFNYYHHTDPLKTPARWQVQARTGLGLVYCIQKTMQKAPSPQGRIGLV